MNDNISVGVLDMYDGIKNEGMRCIRALLENEGLAYKVYNVRGEAEMPALSDHQIYISSGGPGSPLPKGEDWETIFGRFVDDCMAHNKVHQVADRKYVLFICHSFQLMCHHFGLANIIKRQSKSFGIFPVHKTAAGERERLFNELSNPFWVADFREWQAVQPNKARLKELGAKILLLEKVRPHVDLERAVMSIRLTDEIIGTQFHPEADADGMALYFQEPERKAQVVAEYGQRKHNNMIRKLTDPEKIGKTHSIIIPSFLQNAVSKITANEVVEI